MSWVKQAMFIVRKDVLLEWRGRSRFISVLLFGIGGSITGVVVSSTIADMTDATTTPDALALGQARTSTSSSYTDGSVSANATSADRPASTPARSRPSTARRSVIERRLERR